MNIGAIEKELVKKYHEYRLKDAFLIKLHKFTTTEISDALGGNNVMEAEIKPIDQNMRILGRALTVRLPYEDSLLTHKAIDIAKPGDILVIDTSNTKNKAAWGDIKTLKAMKQNIGGIVVDGAIRDVARNKELEFPVFTRYIVPSASKQVGEGELNVPIICGKVEVHPGDIVVGDENGVVIIPKNKLDKVIEKASKKLVSDEEKIKRFLLEYMEKEKKQFIEII